MANTSFVGGRSLAGMRFFHGEVAEFLGSNAGFGLGPSLARLSPGGQGQAEMQLLAAACQCCSTQPVQLCNICRPPERLRWHTKPRGFAEWGSGNDVTARSGQRDNPPCVARWGSGAQLLLRTRGSELHPWVRKSIPRPAGACRLALGCSRNTAHPLLSPRQHTTPLKIPTQHLARLQGQRIT